MNSTTSALEVLEQHVAACKVVNPRLLVVWTSAPACTNVLTTSATPAPHANSKGVDPTPCLASKLTLRANNCLTRPFRPKLTSLPSQAKCKHVEPKACWPVMGLFSTDSGVIGIRAMAARCARQDYELASMAQWHADQPAASRSSVVGEHDTRGVVDSGA